MAPLRSITSNTQNTSPLSPKRWRTEKQSHNIHAGGQIFLWRKLAGAAWLARHEAPLRALAGTKLAIIQPPNGSRVAIEVAGSNRRELKQLRRSFGGTIDKLPRDWLRQFHHGRSAPIRIGQRLLIVASRNCGAVSTRAAGPAVAPCLSREAKRAASLIIPAGAAFGTGEHVTTAMSLRILERLSRKWPPGWGMLDLGTGSGILALAAKKFGAGNVLGVDFDPLALSTARANARLNRVAGVQFRVGDVRECANVKTLHIEPLVVTANLYSELLLEIVPRLRGLRWLIASGVLRAQETELARVLERNGFAIAEVRRRGKWIALCASSKNRVDEAPPRSNFTALGRRTCTRGG